MNVRLLPITDTRTPSKEVAMKFPCDSIKNAIHVFFFFRPSACYFNPRRRWSRVEHKRRRLQSASAKQKAAWAPRFYFQHSAGLFRALAERQIISFYRETLLRSENTLTGGDEGPLGVEAPPPLHPPPKSPVQASTSKPVTSHYRPTAEGEKMAANKQTQKQTRSE